jgi:microcystin degradation protein MlrC
MAWGNRPMMPHIMRQATAESPMRELIQAARQAEADGALAVSVFCGFPHADVPHAGLSAVAVTDRDMAGAEAVCGDLLTQAWLNRGGFVYHGEPAAEAVARAAKLAEGPIVLLDHCDNCGSGGTQDVMAVLAEILEQGLENVAAFAIHDPWAVDQMTQAGVGAEVTLPLGGKIDMPGIGRKGEPYTVTGTVKVLSGGTYTIQGPMYNGVEVHMGRTAVLDTGKVEIVVIERHHEPWDMGCLQSLGIEPTAKRYIMLKSRVHWRAGFWPVVRHVVECAGIGVTTSDYSQLNYTKVRRPIFPLDAEAGIEPEA